MSRFALSTLLAVAVAFLAGLAVGRYTTADRANTSPPSASESDSLGDDLGPVRLVVPTPVAPIGQAKLASNAGSPSTATIVAALKNAMAHPSDRHGYLEASKLIDGIDPKNIRSVIDAFQAVPNQREKSVYLSMLLARWA